MYAYPAEGVDDRQIAAALDHWHSDPEGGGNFVQASVAVCLSVRLPVAGARGLVRVAGPRQL